MKRTPLNRKTPLRSKTPLKAKPKADAAPRKPLLKRRRSTGERDLFVQLWTRCGGKSEVSGTTLLSPEHHRFHAQGSHLLPKGAYPDYRLDPRNVVMITIREHEEWHSTSKAQLLKDPRWEPIVERYLLLFKEAHTKRARHAD